VRSIGATLILVLIVAIPAPAAELPSRKPGLWQVRTSPDFSRCLVERWGGLTSVVVRQGQSFGHGFLARCGELAGIIRRIMKLGCFPCGPRVQMAALSSAAHAVRKTSV
jgi:hypothetical protein